MLVYIVTVVVAPERVQDFIAASEENRAGSIQEPGVLRFDVLQNAQVPSRFTLYEAYRSEADTAAHKLTAHYLKWRDRVSPWMAEPRTGVAHRVICPAGEGAWTR
jgi:(4S)-4-hydroxy-5-phosphonooxypentane-2,3-dione isomerase